MSQDNAFASAMSALQNKIRLSSDLMQLIVVAHQISNETVNMIEDCAKGLIDTDQLVAFLVRVVERVTR